MRKNLQQENSQLLCIIKPGSEEKFEVGSAIIIYANNAQARFDLAYGRETAAQAAVLTVQDLIAVNVLLK